MSRANKLLDHDIPEAEAAAREARGAAYDRYAGPCDYPPHALAMTPEYQRIVGELTTAIVTAKQWSDVANAISSARNGIAAPQANKPEMQAVMASAKRAIGPLMGEATRNSAEWWVRAGELRRELRRIESEYHERGGL